MKTVLIIDDSVIQRQAIKGILKELDFHVEEASDGSESLEILSNKDFDVILLDLYMPKVSGLDVLEKLKVSQLAKVIIISANIQPTVRSNCEALGAKHFVNKPIDSIDLIENVAAIVEGV